MVRQAVRQAHGPEQSRRTHHPEPSRRANHNDRNSKFDTAESFDPEFFNPESLDPELTTEGLVAGQTIGF